MDIMYSLYKHWCDKIFNGEKTLEFRTKLPKHIDFDSKLYFYETKKFGGCGMVVGECGVSDIISLLNKDGKYPYIGAYSFLEYFYDNIVHKHDIAEVYRKVKKEFDGKFTNYKYGFIAEFAFSEENLENIKKTGEPIDTWKIFDTKLVRKILDDRELSRKYIECCDNWLSDIGFYDDIGESNYRYGIVLKNPIKYITPIPVSSFQNVDDKNLMVPPQSYYYVKKNHQ